jgi:hypothetical protein
LPTGNENPIEVVNTPKRVEIKVVRGVNFPEAKDSDKYYVSVLVEEMRGKICYQTKKFKSKTIRGSQPEWNKHFTIKTQHPESCLITIKVKKSSKLGSKTSTVGFVKMAVSSLDDNVTETMQLYDEDHNPVGEACLEVDMKISDLPEVVPSPAEVKRQERKLKAHKILYQRHEATLMKAEKKRQERMLMDVPKLLSSWRKLKDLGGRASRNWYSLLVRNQFLEPDGSLHESAVQIYEDIVLMVNLAGFVLVG